MMRLRNLVGACLAVAAFSHSGSSAAQPVSSDTFVQTKINQAWELAQQGNSEGEFRIGEIYDQGTPFRVARDPELALQWYTRAADHGHAEAAFRIGLMWATYRTTGAKIDQVKAREWFKRSAEMGHSGAQSELSTYAAHGLGGPVDLCEALKWERAVYEYLRPEGGGNAVASRNQVRFLEGEVAAQGLKCPAVTNSNPYRTLIDTIFWIVSSLIAIALAVVFWRRQAIAVWARRKFDEHLAWIEAQANPEQERRRREIEPLVNERFPENFFPRFPKHIREFIGWPAKGASDDQDWDQWEALLNDWPDTPKNEAERKQRESDLWRRVMLARLDTDASSPVLWPKQDIIDDWWDWERLWFKRYFAATGIHHPSVYSHKFFAIMEIRYKYRKRKSWNTTDAEDRRQMEEYQRATRELDDFMNREMPAHKEKWGQWFFFNVEQAFKAEHGGPDTGLDQQNVHGDARVMTEDETLEAATEGAGQRSPIHEQRF